MYCNTNLNILHYKSMKSSQYVRPCGLIDKALELDSRDAGSSPVMVIKLMLYKLDIIIAT